MNNYVLVLPAVVVVIVVSKYLHKNVKYDAEVHMNLMNGFLSFWEKLAHGQMM